MPLGADIVRALAAGRPRSAAALAAALGTTRAAVASALRSLPAWGLEVEVVRGRGYRLRAPLELLDQATIESTLDGDARARLQALEVLAVTESTNSQLFAASAPAPGCWHACLAEYQSAGRGRRGRGWIAPYASGLCLSFGWTFAAVQGGFAALGLAAGVATLRALAQHGVQGVRLKWPNDVLYGTDKLGGILSELRADANGATRIVVGIGLNVRLPAAAGAAIAAAGGLPAVDLVRVSGAAGPPPRSQLAGSLLTELVRMARAFESSGLSPFIAEWNAADALRDRTVRVSGELRAREGIARGIDVDGALRLEADGRLERLVSGEVTLRAVA